MRALTDGAQTIVDCWLGGQHGSAEICQDPGCLIGGLRAALDNGDVGSGGCPCGDDDGGVVVDDNLWPEFLHDLRHPLNWDVPNWDFPGFAAWNGTKRVELVGPRVEHVP